MTSTLKVDQIQLADGSTPTIGDLAINDSGTVLQVQSSVLLALIHINRPKFY